MTIDQQAKELLLRDEVIQYYPNGQLYLHYYLIDGKQDSEFKMWYDNGQLREHCFYKNGQLDGEYKKWHKNGELLVYCVFQDDNVIKDL